MEKITGEPVKVHIKIYALRQGITLEQAIIREAYEMLQAQDEKEAAGATH